jgi:sulfur carrier protein ThiS
MDGGRGVRAQRVKVRLWGELSFYGPGKRGRFEVPISQEMPVSDALRLIGVPAADVAVLGRNGEVVRLDDPTITVDDEDRIDCFPPTSGG